jgi:PAS domain S-box-containing protein
MSAGRPLRAGGSLLTRWKLSTPQCVLILFVAYFATAYLSLFLRESTISITAIWPPSGLALAALLLADRKRWPWLAATIFAANALANLCVGRTWLTCLGMATTNTSESLLAAWCILRAVGARPTMREMKDVFALTFWGALFAAGMTSYLGGLLILGASGDSYRRIVIGWWIAVASGMLSVTPAVLLLASLDFTRWRRVLRGRVLEVALLAVASAGVISLVFGAEPRQSGDPMRSPILVVPFLMWAAMRFGPVGAVLAVHVLAASSVWLTAHGQGPFADSRMSAYENVLSLQVFLASLSIPTLALGALLAERWRVEEELLESQSTARRAEEFAHIGSWIVEFDRESTASWSREKARILGISTEALRGTLEAFLSLVHAEDRARVEQAVHASRMDGVAYSVEHRIVRPDGNVRWVHGMGDVVRDASGRPSRMIGVLQDITKRKQDERLLDGQKRILETLARGVRLDAVLHDLIRFIEREAEGAACSVILGEMQADNGFRVQRAVGSKIVAESLKAMRGAVFAGDMGTCGAASASKKLEVSADIAADPRYRDLRSVLLPLGLQGSASAPILGLDGSLLGTICLLLPAPRSPSEFELRLIETAANLAAVAIERSRDAEAILKMNSELEQRVLERTAQLEAANSELEAFSYSVSHDLRSPLRAIDGYTNIVLEEHVDSLGAGARRQLAMISSSARRMGELIDDLLEFSRLSREPLRVERLDPRSLVDSVLQELLDPSADQPLDVRIRSMPACTADPSLLRQVYVNLIDNALKFSRTRRPAILDIGAGERDGEVVYFVRDNGIGFDMRHASQLFAVFQRLHNCSEYPGTGVGLALTQRIVQRHGGRIWAESEPKMGTTFYFTLLPRGGRG